jgi:hypothetical protein
LLELGVTAATTQYINRYLFRFSTFVTYTLKCCDSIVALASGAGAIAVIRISGPEAITIGNVFKSIKNKDLSKQKTHTLHLGHIMDDKKRTKY